MQYITGKITSAVIAAVIIISSVSATPALAESGAAVSMDKINIPSEEVISTPSADVAWPAEPEVDAESAIVMDANTGLVLYEKDADAQQYPASITKIMTTLLALENSTMDETVTFSATAVYENEGDTSNIARDVGEEMTMEQTLYAVMLESANECAWAVAEHVGDGDVQSFVDMMNERAAALGCTNTHFTNPNGLPDEDHYTSCRDMALIAQDAIKNTMFRKIIGTVQYIIPPTNKHEDETLLNNHHRMLSPYKGSKYLYKYCIGGKTGYTEAAQNTLVTYVEKDGELLICVVMKTMSPYEDTTALFDYCLDNFEFYNIYETETRISDESGFAIPDTDAMMVLPRGADFNDTEVTLSFENASSSVLGTLVYTYGGKEIGFMDISFDQVQSESYQFDELYETEKEDPNISVFNIFMARVRGFFGRFLNAQWSLWMKAAVVIVVAVVVVLIVILLNSRGRRRSKRAARRGRYKPVKYGRGGKKRRGRRRY